MAKIGATVVTPITLLDFALHVSRLAYSALNGRSSRGSYFFVVTVPRSFPNRF